MSKPEIFKYATFQLETAARQLEEQGCVIDHAAQLAEQEQTLFTYARAFCEEAAPGTAKAYLLFLFKDAMKSSHASWEYISGIALLIRWIGDPK